MTTSAASVVGQTSIVPRWGDSQTMPGTMWVSVTRLRRSAACHWCTAAAVTSSSAATVTTVAIVSRERARCASQMLRPIHATPSATIGHRTASL